MIYNYVEFENPLRVRDFNRYDCRDFDFVITSPVDMNSKRATLSDPSIGKLYIDLLCGLRDDRERYMFLINIHNDEDGTDRIYGEEFTFDLSDETMRSERAAADQAENYFMETLKQLKSMLLEDNDDDIVTRIGKLAEKNNMVWLFCSTF